MSTGRDLRKYQDGNAIQDAFSQLVSGRPGYKTVIERRKIPPKCEGCGRGGDEDQKFCTQCGGKMVVPLTNCPECNVSVDEEDNFCQECGHKLKG